MVIQKSYKDENGIEHIDLLHTTTDDEKMFLLQVGTNKIYEEAIDKVPCKHTYIEIPKEPDEEDM